MTSALYTWLHWARLSSCSDKTDGSIFRVDIKARKTKKKENTDEEISEE